MTFFQDASPNAGRGSFDRLFQRVNRSKTLEISRERVVLKQINQKLRLVAISDLHLPCSWGSAIDLPRVINAEGPDVFIVAGDTVDTKGHEHLVARFSGVNARYSKLAILGNWEYHGSLDIEKLADEYENAGVSLLVNNVVETAGLNVVGLDDLIKGSPDFNMLDQFSDRGKPLLVLSHCPESFDFISDKLDIPTITISGHTHGGQIAPFGKALLTPRGSGAYLHGWYHRGRHSMYVMRGIGTSGVPFRYRAVPELLVLDVEGRDC